jgi:hypothetical protein
MVEKLLKTFGNHTRSLEILYLMEDVKGIVRLDADEVELGKIKAFCNENDLTLEISDFKVAKVIDKGKGGYANIVKKVPLNYPGNGLYHVYISKDTSKSKFLKLLENKNDDNAVGELLGYPKCCVEFFIANKEKQRKLQNDYILPALDNSDGFKFPFYNNHAVRYFDITLLSHFPHSFECEESIKIAKNNLEVIKKYSKELADKFVVMLKSAVLYTENDGVFVFKNHKLNDNILTFNGIKSTINNNLFNDLNNNKKLGIVDKNKIELNGKLIENVGLMVFI